jgi:hypothetical protein
LSFSTPVFVSALTERDSTDPRNGKGKGKRKKTPKPIKPTKNRNTESKKNDPKKPGKPQNRQKKWEQPTGGRMESSKKRMDGTGVGSKVRVEQRKKRE